MTKTSSTNTDRKLVWITVVITAFLVLTVVLLFIVARKDDAMQGADQAIKLSAQGGFSCEYAEAQKLYAFGEGILKVTGDRVAYLTLSGNEVFSKTVNFSNPQAYIKGDKAVVFDMNGYGFVLLDHENVLLEKPTQYKIKSAYLSDNDLVAVITDCDQGYGIVEVLSADGKSLLNWTSYSSGYPLSVAFNEDASMFAVTTLNTAGAVYVPYIRLFNYNESTQRYDDYAFYTVEDTTIFSAAVYCGDTLFTFTTDSIYQLKDNTLTRLETNLGVINQVNSVDGVVFVVHSDGVDQVNSVAVLNENGEIIYDSPVGSNINTVAVSNDLYALSIDNSIYVFNKNGSVISDITVDEDVLRIGFVGNNKLIVISTGGVHTVDY